MMVGVVFSVNRTNMFSVSFPGKKHKVEEMETWKVDLPVGRINVGGRI